MTEGALRANRLFQVLLICSTVGFSWLAMQVVHESGHIFHAWLSGGRVTKVFLSPLETSRTDVVPDPHPQFVAWGGPVWGSILPPIPWAVARWRRWPRAWLARFFAGFCLAANGAYLLGGSLYPAGDAQVLLEQGAPRLALTVFGMVTIAAGLWLWNGLGSWFGFGKDARPIDKRAALGTTAAAAILAASECAWTWKFGI